jgi:hypothetical protein
VEYQQNPTQLDPTKYMTVVSGAKVGNRALLVKASGNNPSMITHALPSGLNKVYIRAWVKSKVQLGQNNPDSNNHETLMGLRGKAGDANNEIRFGEIKGALGTNEVSSDDISPKQDQWGKGAALKANTWYCVEVAFRGDMAYNSLYAYVDGQLIHSITSATDWTHGSLTSSWMNGRFKEVIFGWHIVVSKETIGCEYTVGSGPQVQ